MGLVWLTVLLARLQLELMDGELSPRSSKVFQPYMEKGRQAITAKSNAYAELINAYDLTTLRP